MNNHRPDPYGSARTIGARISVAKQYDALAAWMDEEAGWYRDEHLEKVLCQVVPANIERGLELCCGSGRVLSCLSNSRQWMELAAVDISSEMVERARRRLGPRKNVQIYLGDWLEPLPVRTAGFDVVIVKNALHLLSDLEGKLRAVLGVTREDACLIVVETVSPNARAQRFVRKLFRCVDTNGLKKEIFSIQGLRRALRRSGWDITFEISVKQKIDVGQWLLRKCRSDAVRMEAEELLVACPEDVRRKMSFEPVGRGVPSQMLRLQHVMRCRKVLQERQLSILV